MLKKNTFHIRAKDGKQLFVYSWLPEEGQCKGIVQIAHGMSEHMGRYEEFASKLVQEGYGVYGNDHRGHGLTAKSPEERGYFAPEKGWNMVVEDMYTLTKHIKKQWTSQPILLFGHSMGSLLSRHYISLYGKEIKAVTLSGTSGLRGMILDAGRGIAKIQCSIKGEKYKSLILDKLSFGSFNEKFLHVRTPFDWLSRDEKEVDKYIEDPLCGEVFTCSFFYDLFTGMKIINKKEVVDNIPKNLPILLISGDKDPVGGNTKGVLYVYNRYKNAGIRNTEYHFYRDARHELLHEINRQEIIRDIIAWMNKYL